MSLGEQILKYLINDWRTRNKDIINEKEFVSNFGDQQDVRDVLRTLHLRGYINVSYADDTIYLISLNKKFKHEY